MQLERFLFLVFSAASIVVTNLANAKKSEHETARHGDIYPTKLRHERWSNRRKRNPVDKHVFSHSPFVVSGSLKRDVNTSQFDLNSISTTHRVEHSYDKTTSPPLPEECPHHCYLQVENLQEIHRLFQDAVENTQAYMITFKIHFQDSKLSLLERFPFMGDTFRASEWTWARGKLGRTLLGLPLDADVLSIYLLPLNKPTIPVHVHSNRDECFERLPPSCRLKAAQDIIINNVTRIRDKEERNYVCHKVVKDTDSGSTYKLLYKCCDTAEYLRYNGLSECNIYSQPSPEISGCLILINILAGLVTIFSPVFIMQIKLTLSYDSTTKFFRASLKHGITGQRNYVIRISSRQLINLSDTKPFSIPRFLFRLLFHCYGEGRCCIHWWGEWSNQPRVCRKDALCKRIYMIFWRAFAFLVLCPIVFYVALALYLARLQFYYSVLELVDRYSNEGVLDLDINLMAFVIMPQLNPIITIWIGFAFISFLYAVFIVSWPTNTLENCLVRAEGKRASQKPKLLYSSLTRGYKNVLHRLAYGDFRTKRHCFRINIIPWGIRRTFLFISRVLVQIPIINVAFMLLRFDSRLFGLRENGESNIDELTDSAQCSKDACPRCCKWLLTIIIWIGFLAVLCGYCSAVFITVQFVLNIAFFMLLAIVLNSHIMLPWTCFIVIVILYINNTLSIVNKEHKEILRLIDANSPRISAVEDSENGRRDSGIQILKTHNLGAVKFIDGDNTEYVSKELYYGVCNDLKCGWSVCIRRILHRCGACAFYAFLVFMCLHTFSALLGSSLLSTLLAIIISLMPLAKQHLSRPEYRVKAKVWAKIIPDVLDKHIRVDRTKCLDDMEEALSTYDVRPVGHLEMELPKMVAYGNLRMWKFPWIVSADQQTTSPEGFITALASKLAAATFLSKIVTRLYSPELHDDEILRHWCLLVENCIVSGSSTANSINGVPLESVRLFPREVQSLVSHFRTGSTVDNVVDNINRELYGPYTKGALVTIGNTPMAICKLDSLLFAFNAGCHGEQVTDLFGALLIMAEFNTQNLQTIVKFIMDPYSPDTVPVYTIIPMEGFIFQSPEILELESPSA